MGREVAAGGAVGDTGTAGDLAEREGLDAFGVHELDADVDEPGPEPAVLGSGFLMIFDSVMHGQCLPSPSRHCLLAHVRWSATLRDSEGE
ncbi:hypothetical protein GCM10018791_51560 [Streptomyces zaomyceticus]|nr:hypothetical protein GCM10018791_51560 [Streptomyces zaomyceticus]